MLGNWAVGKPNMATNPMITMRMAMTIATMGRFMKKFAMTLSSLGLGGLGGCGGSLWVDRRSFLHLLEALDDHPLSRFDPFGDDPHRTYALTHFHWAHASLV